MNADSQVDRNMRWVYKPKFIFFLHCKLTYTSKVWHINTTSYHNCNESFDLLENVVPKNEFGWSAESRMVARLI